MHRLLLIALAGYAAFVCQPLCRTAAGTGPNCLVLALLLALWGGSDRVGLLAAAAVGLGADVWTTQGLGIEMLTYLVWAIALQSWLPPRQIQHPLLWIPLVAGTATGIELTSLVLRCMCLPTQVPLQFSSPAADWISALRTACIDGLWSAGVAAGPVLVLFAIQKLTTSTPGERTWSPLITNRWQRLN